MSDITISSRNGVENGLIVARAAALPTANAAEPLDKKLRNVIARLSDTVRTSQLISLNISLLAVRGAHNLEANNAAIQVVAAEIQRLNGESNANIEELHAVLTRVQTLTRIINTAGRQRMLSQKIMKLFLVQQIKAASGAREEMEALMKEFSNTLAALLGSELNTAEIRAQLSRVHERWKLLASAIHDGDIDSAIPLNEQVLSEMHRGVQLYEALAGGGA